MHGSAGSVYEGMFFRIALLGYERVLARRSDLWAGLIDLMKANVECSQVKSPLCDPIDCSTDVTSTQIAQ